MTLWGVGPKLVFIAILYAAFTVTASYTCRPIFDITGVSETLFLIIGFILFAIGMPLWIISIRTFRKAFKEARLVTDGIYSLCRHPAYASLVLFIIPGIIIIFLAYFPFHKSWLVLTIPLFMYFALKKLVKREEEYLERRFGQQYLEYKKKTNAIFPSFKLFK